MIYTKFGTPVKLASAIDPFTGWVTVIADLGLNGSTEKEVDVMDLRADGGYEEIETASNQFITVIDETPEHVKGDDPIDRLMRRDWPADPEWQAYRDSD